MGFHGWRYLELQDLCFWEVVYDALLYDCAEAFFYEQGVGDKLVFVVHADSAAVGTHVLVLDRNKLASGGSDYEVNVAL